MFRRRREGATITNIAAEFETSIDAVRHAVSRVESHERGLAMLRDDPFDIEALSLTGRLPAHARRALRVRGMARITELVGVSLIDMQRWPNVGRKSARRLLELLEECLATARR